jgi:hypothetical protein
MTDFEEFVEELYHLNASISLSLAIRGRPYTKADALLINQRLGSIIKRMRTKIEQTEEPVFINEEGGKNEAIDAIEKEKRKKGSLIKSNKNGDLYGISNKN